MREGKITSLCEQGIGEYNGRHRLTFFSETQRFRLVVDEKGSVVLAIDFANRPLSVSARKPGA